MHHRKLFVLGILALVLFFPGRNFAAISYRITAGATVNVDEHGVCSRVNNATALDLFIPTKTAAEWASFVAGPPANVNLAACTTYAALATSTGGVITTD